MLMNFSLQISGTRRLDEDQVLSGWTILYSQSEVEENTIRPSCDVDEDDDDINDDGSLY